MVTSATKHDNGQTVRTNSTIRRDELERRNTVKLQAGSDMISIGQQTGTCDIMTKGWFNDSKLVMNQKIPSDIPILHVP